MINNEHSTEREKAFKCKKIDSVDDNDITWSWVSS